MRGSGDAGIPRTDCRIERLNKIHLYRILTQLPTSEIARGLFRLTRARRYQNSVREFVTKFRRVRHEFRQVLQL